MPRLVRFLTIFFLISFGILTTLTVDTDEPRTVHEPDLNHLAQRVLIDTYTVDPIFIEFIAHPSEFFTDPFGIYVLKDFTQEQILNDYVPRYATLIQSTNTTIELKFNQGWNATFYPHSLLKIRNATIARDHIYISGDDAKELIENLQDFRQILNETKLQSNYLVPNPFYDMEKLVNRTYYSGKPTITVIADPNMTIFQTMTNAVMIYPDRVHGDLPSFKQFMEILQRADIQWLGMEMLPSSMQTTLDIFCTASENSSAYIDARANLTDYFLFSWTPYFKLNITSGDQSPYFQVVDLVRQKKGRVYGLDLASIDFILFRYGEMDFGAAVRSLNWANSVPTKGRGILFGGSAHFTMNRSSNVQDFLANRDNQLALFSIQPLHSLTNNSHRIFYSYFSIVLILWNTFYVTLIFCCLLH